MMMDMPPPQILIPPAGFTPPPEAESGKSFDVVARVSFQDGELVVESINGESLAGDIPMEDEFVEEEVVEEIPADLGAAMRASGLPV